MPNNAHDPRPALLAECLQIARQESSGLIQRVLAAGARSLVHAIANAGSGFERGRLSDAAEALHRNGPPMGDGFPKFLDEEVRLPASAGHEGARALSFDSLELMAEDQVDDTVELVRGQQAVMSAVEPELVQLNALVSAVQGHELVQAATNPLRPEVWVKALHRALGRGGASSAVRALWMQHLSPAYGAELAALYRRISDHMLQQGVAAAAYRVAPPKHEARRRAEAAQFTLRDLKRLLVNATRGEGDTQGLTRPAGQTMNGMTLPAAMLALQDMNKMDDVVRRMQERWRAGVWHGEKAEADAGVAGIEYTPTQTLAREVVHQMVENIAADPRLLPDIQHVVRKLEPPLLYLAVHDQRFFTDRKHPARELLEEVTQRSLAFAQKDTAGFAEFFAPVHEAAQMLSQMAVLDEEPFLFTLQTLRESWSEFEERDRKRRATMARALIKADARNHAAATVAGRLHARPDVTSTPPAVRAFLLGPWSQVIAAAKLESPEAQDPGGYEALVDDIAWSSQPRLAPQNLSRAQRIASTLPGIVRQGLAKIGASTADVSSSIERLQSVQQSALRGEAIEDTDAATRPSADAIEWHADALPWLSPDEVQDSKLLQLADFSETVLESRPAALNDAATAQLAAGQIVEVMLRGSWARWKLAWSSPHGTMLMFTDAGGRPESMTRQTLARMLDAREARLLQSGSVVDSALDAVAQAALENSGHSPM